MRLKTLGNSSELQASSGDLQTKLSQWIHAAAVYSGTNMYTYQDGGQTGILAKSGTISRDNSIDIGIGNQPSGGRTIDGILDEVRVIRKARSSGWLITEYNNHSDPGTFYSVSGQTDHSA